MEGLGVVLTRTSFMIPEVVVVGVSPKTSGLMIAYQKEFAGTLVLIFISTP